MNTKTTVVTQEQLDAQFACCDKIASYWAQRGITPVAYVETYGCQQNEADSEKLRGYLSQCGYAIGTTAEGADVVVMNTCAIREHAERLHGWRGKGIQAGTGELSSCGRGIFHPSPGAVS